MICFTFGACTLGCVLNRVVFPSLPNRRQLKASHWLNLARPKVSTDENLGHCGQPYGREFSTGRVLGVSAVLGSFFLRPHFAHCMDGYASSVDDRSMDVFGKSEADDNRHNAMIFFKRILVPIALLWLMWTHWDYPIALGVKVLLTLLSTKPSRSSVYVFIEQLQKQYRSEHPILHKFKSLHAQKLEVEDYSVFCIAKVEIGEQKYTLLGIAGGWWVFEISFRSALSGFKSRTLELLETAVSSVG